jgi:hypothetical protein
VAKFTQQDKAFSHLSSQLQQEERKGTWLQLRRPSRWKAERPTVEIKTYYSPLSSRLQQESTQQGGLRGHHGRRYSGAAERLQLFFFILIFFCELKIGKEGRTGIWLNRSNK